MKKIKKYDFLDIDVVEEIKKDLLSKDGEGKLGAINDILNQITNEKNTYKTDLAIYDGQEDIFPDKVEEIEQKIGLLEFVEEQIKVIKEPYQKSYNKIHKNKK